MDDLISRQQAIDAVKKAWSEYEGNYDCRSRYGVISDSIENIKNLPSVQPEQRWIPMSEQHKNKQSNRNKMPLPEPYQKGGEK